MNVPMIIERQSQSFEVFVPDFPDCVITAATPAEARTLARAAIQSQVEQIILEGGDLPGGDARIETIEVTLPSSLTEKTDRYEVIIERAPGNYAAWVPNLPVCFSVGDTLEEMRAMIKEAIELHIETLVEFGDPIPPKSSLVEMVEVDVPQQATAEVAD